MRLGALSSILRVTLFAGRTVFCAGCAVLLLTCSGAAEQQPPTDPDGAAELGSLPYLTWVPADSSDGNGVTMLDEARSHPGHNLFGSRHLPSASLIDRHGRVLHTWSKSLRRGDSWQVVRLGPDGSLYAIAKDRRLMKVDRDSDVIWKRGGRFHHDLWLAEDGRILALSRRARRVEDPERGPMRVLEDLIVTLSDEGSIEETLSLYDAARPLISPSALDRAAAWSRENVGVKRLQTDTAADLTHTNSLAQLHRSIPGIADAGSLLVSVRQIGRILILDRATGALLWEWGEGVLGGQHHASQLPNGNLLVFDNFGAGRGWSRVLEVDPLSSAVVWEFRAPVKKAFYSHLRGGAQRLPNGNTLITESDRGRIFEVTPGGDVVWEFLNPATRKRGRERAAIYRLTRIVDPERLRWLRPGPAVE